MIPAVPAGSHHPTSDEAAAPVAAAGSHHPTSDDDAAPVAIAGDDLLPYYCNHNEDPRLLYTGTSQAIGTIYPDLHYQKNNSVPSLMSATR